MTPDESQRPDTAGDAKKPYVEPRLVEYGSVSKLTQNTAFGSFADNGGQMMVMACL